MINIFDIVILLMCLGMAAAGYKEGLVRGAIKLGGFFVTIILVILLAGSIVDFAKTFSFLAPQISIPLAFAVIFAVGLLTFHFAAEFLYKVIHLTPAGFIDSGFGCALGGLKAVLTGGILAAVLSIAPEGSFFLQQFRDSHSAAPLKSVVSLSLPFARRNLERLHDHLKGLPDREDTSPRDKDNIDNETSDVII